MSDIIQAPSFSSLDLSKPEQAAQFLVEAADWYQQFQMAQKFARQMLRDEADARGQRTFELDGRKIVVDNPSWDRSYDVAKLHDGLAEAGLSADRLSELITWEPRVDGKVIRELERHGQYKQAIDAAIQSVAEKTRRVVVEK